MGLIDTIRGWFGRAVTDAGFPATGDAVSGGALRRYSLGSYHELLGRSGYYYGGPKWAYGLSGSGRGPMLDHATLRANARAAVHDSMPARAIVERYQQTVVDTGVRVECAPDAEVLGIDPEQAETWARDVEQRFNLWASSKLVTVGEDMSFYQAQRFSMRARMRDGEYFVRCYYDSRRDLLNPLRIGFIDPNQITGDALTDTVWPETVADGIKRDKLGREVAFEVLIRQPSGKIEKVIVPAKGRAGLPLMLHGFAPEYAGQSRGFSRLSHAIQEFQNLTDFTSAQIKKAIAQSSLALFLEPGEKNDAINPFGDMLSGPVNSFDEPETPGETTTALSGEESVNYSRLNSVSFDPGSVGVFNLLAGQKLVPFKDSAPSESFDSFVTAFVGYLAASVNMPPEVLALKFSQNYSASRAALILMWRTACVERDEEASDFYNPIYRAWLHGEIAAGRISAPGWSDPRRRAAWSQATWNGPPMPNIDPAKTAKADKDYVELGAQTLDHVARNFNGSSGAANRMKNARQISQLTPVPWSSKKDAASAPEPGALDEED